MAAKLLILTILLQISFIFAKIENCPDVEGNSLAFIVANSASMANYIEQVKVGINEVFDTVLNAKFSPIENFLLVSFDDRDSKAVLINKDPVALKEALKNIHANGATGSKYTMMGLQDALQRVLSLSHLYVFTDAPAKDFQKYEQIKRLAQEKSAQISFILTGEQDYEHIADYAPYYNLARATAGFVVPADKLDIPEIMHYISESAKYCRVQLYHGKLEAGYGQSIKFGIEENQSNVQISAFGDQPKLDAVYNSANAEQGLNVLVNTERMIVVKFLSDEAGEYTAKIGGKGATTVLIDATQVVGFTHGFSTIKPHSLADTTILPKSGVKSYLAVKIHEYKTNVKLQKVKLLDLDDNVSREYPVKVFDEEGLYITDLLEVPRNLFRILVVGYDVSSNATISSMGRTPLEAV